MPDVDGIEGNGTDEVGTVEDAGETPTGGSVTPIRSGAEPEDKAPALSAALLAELEAHRTAGLASRHRRAARACGAGACCTRWRRMPSISGMARRSQCFHTYPPALASACPGIADNPARQAMREAEDAWRARLPQEHGALWGWLQDQDAPTLLGLLAVCVARTVNAGSRTWTTPEGSASVAAQVATAAGLDMRQCWTATKESYLGRVQKALILDAVREGAGAGVAGRIAHAKKEVMVADAAQVLDGKGWLPAVLRVPGTAPTVDSTDASASTLMPMAAE